MFSDEKNNFYPKKTLATLVDLVEMSDNIYSFLDEKWEQET